MVIKDNIKNIIFDLGGVILNVDYKSTIEEFKKLGVLNFELIFSQFKQLDFSDKFEIDEISEEEFYEEIKRLTNVNFSFLQFKYAWNAMLLDLPQKRIHLLRKLKANYNLYLYSNTNETHYRNFHFKVKEDFDSIFEKTYYSHLFGKRKPHVNSFETILKENNLIPHETLFLDDSIQHILGAKSAGIITKLIDNEPIEELF
jgi:putative hydrolase of the HAD superfamily